MRTYYPPSSASGIPDDIAATMRELMSSSGYDRLEMADEPPARFGPEAAEFGREFPIVSLTIHRWAAPAPWAGRPFCYEWKVALSDADPDRWVTGDAFERVMDIDPRFEERRS